MSALIITANNVTAARFPLVQNETHAYRHFGGGMHPLVLLQHFMETPHNWDLAEATYQLRTKLGLNRQTAAVAGVGWLIILISPLSWVRLSSISRILHDTASTEHGRL